MGLDWRGCKGIKEDGDLRVAVVRGIFGGHNVLDYFTEYLFARGKKIIFLRRGWDRIFYCHLLLKSQLAAKEPINR